MSLAEFYSILLGWANPKLEDVLKVNGLGFFFFLLICGMTGVGWMDQLPFVFLDQLISKLA